MGIVFVSNNPRKVSPIVPVFSSIRNNPFFAFISSLMVSKEVLKYSLAQSNKPEGPAS